MPEESIVIGFSTVDKFQLVARSKPGQVILAMKLPEDESLKSNIDPAGVFASAISIWNECNGRAKENPSLNLSDAYHGMDQLMRVGEVFENWACLHVAFEEFPEVWPYFLEDRFGGACLLVIEAEGLAGFSGDDCLRIAYRLRLPVRLDDALYLPVDVRASNPISDSAFKEFRIRTLREDLEDGEVVPFSYSDEPFDGKFDRPYFGFYGVGEDGLLEHIADRKTYGEARSLALKIAPGLVLPEVPICLADDSCRNP